jgi:2-polyprenyl-6-methoxyphenol hydroxylase-like FAD-dependent oxidoreductase
MAPILIVGASTTGLTLACDLARRGVAVRIIEKALAPDTRCRACLVRLRTLEILDDLGVAEEIVAQAQPARGTSIYAGADRLTATRPEIRDSLYTSSVCIQQHQTEQALEGLLNRLGGRVERGTTLIDMTDVEDGSVFVTLQQGGAVERFQAPWVIGCDGAHSRVRQLRGIEFPGDYDALAFLVADVQVTTPAPRDEVAVYLGRDALMMSFPLPGNRTLLFGGDREADAVARDGTPPTVERLQELVHQNVGLDAQVTDPLWLNYFRVQYRVASRFRDGRVFLAGDAAHVFSPAGGQGMNTGIQDAYNLAWKLALVVRGQAHESLLDSYEQERRPVAESQVESTRQLTDNLKLIAELPPLFRQTALQAAATGNGQAQAARDAEQLDIHYGVASGTAEDGAFDSGPTPGARVRPSAALRGTRFTLLLFPGPATDSLQRLRETAALLPDDLVQTHVVPADNQELRRDLGVTGEALYLIRPDGHVAYRAQPVTPQGLRQHLDRILGRAVAA